MKTERRGGSERVVEVVPAGAAEPMVSSHGNARAAPAPRNTVLREILFGIVYLLDWLLTYLTTIGTTRLGGGGAAASIVTLPPWLLRNGTLRTTSRISVRAR